MKKTAIIGIGNSLRKDDSLGLVLLEKLKEKKTELPEGMEFIEGGLGGMVLLHYLADFDIAYIIDAVDFSGEPGELRFFEKDDVVSKKVKISFSTHEDDFLKVVKLSEELNEIPEKIYIFGIQPKDMGLGCDLSPAIEGSIDENLKKIIDKINSLKEKEQ